MYNWPRGSYFNTSAFKKFIINTKLLLAIQFSYLTNIVLNERN